MTSYLTRIVQAVIPATPAPVSAPERSSVLGLMLPDLPRTGPADAPTPRPEGHRIPGMPGMVLPAPGESTVDLPPLLAALTEPPAPPGPPSPPPTSRSGIESERSAPPALAAPESASPSTERTAASAPPPDPPIPPATRVGRAASDLSLPASHPAASLFAQQPAASLAAAGDVGPSVLDHEQQMPSDPRVQLTVPEARRSESPTRSAASEGAGGAGAGLEARGSEGPARSPAREAAGGAGAGQRPVAGLFTSPLLSSFPAPPLRPQAMPSLAANLAAQMMARRAGPPATPPTLVAPVPASEQGPPAPRPPAPAPPLRPQTMPSLVADLAAQMMARRAGPLATPPAPVAPALMPGQGPLAPHLPAPLPLPTGVLALPLKREEASLHIGQIDIMVVNQPAGPAQRPTPTRRPPPRATPLGQPTGDLARQGLAWWHFKL